MFESDDFIKKVYRDYMAEEMNRPEVRSAKKKLLETYAAPGWFPSFLSKPFLIPALCFSIFFGLFYNLQNSAKPILGPLLPVYDEVSIYLSSKPLGPVTNGPAASPQTVGNPASPHVPEEAIIPDDLRRPPVIVKRIASRVGPTMVYQKPFRNHPVTIIWVFAGGKANV